MLIKILLDFVKQNLIGICMGLVTEEKVSGDLKFEE